jgi:hypothetical protein
MPFPEPPWLPPEPPTGEVVRPPAHWPTPSVVRPARSPRRPWAAVALTFAGIIVGTIAAFAPWASYVDGVDLTGVEHGDGWLVLVVVAAAAALAGALAFGWNHLAVRVGLIVAAAALIVVFVLNRVDISRSEDRVTGGPIDVGGGLYALIVAACLVLTGALVIPTREPATSPR